MSALTNESMPSHGLKVLTWNVNSDEIDDGCPMRLQAITREIETSHADVVFLQEVSAEFKQMLLLRLGAVYEFEDCSGETVHPFLVMILLRKGRMTRISFPKRIDFEGGGSSSMGRYILWTEALFSESSTPIWLMTTHMESCKENSVKRMAQYEQLLRLIVQAPDSTIQICGGDFNLREAEDRNIRKRLKKSGVDTDTAVDAFDAAGRPFDATFTWRRRMNTSATATSMQARFDRQLFRSGRSDVSLVDSSFSLLGLDDVAGIDEKTVLRAGFSTPSDHMGILCEYAFGSGQQFSTSSVVSNARGSIAHSSSADSLYVFVLIGAPGSGKTTLAALLSPAFARISQDELGSREKCQDAAEAALQSGVSVVIDRCNFDAHQRATWLTIAGRFSARAIAVQLDVPVSVCCQRVAARRCHEGRLQGNDDSTADIVKKLHSSLERVSDDEGFACVHVFQHTAAPESIATELFNKYNILDTCRNRSSKDASSLLPQRAPSAAHPIGVQSDSSGAESSPDRLVEPLLHLSGRDFSAHTAHAENLSLASASAASIGQVQNQDVDCDDCVMVQHVPPPS
jgi:predicted kinase/endonuclease/exonuclease/phosphatase family metal-dependent hydrolase